MCFRVVTGGVSLCGERHAVGESANAGSNVRVLVVLYVLHLCMLDRFYCEYASIVLMEL